MIIRNINKNDANEIIELLDLGRPYVIPYNEYVYWFLYNYFGTTCKVAVYKERIIGFISVLPSVEKKTLFIWQLCIDKDFRGNGYAERLLDSIFDEAKNLNYNSIQFSIAEDNLSSQKLFRKYANKNRLNISEIERLKLKVLNEIVIQIDL